MNKSKLKPIIGLEIHVELKTKSKMFCGCKNDPFSATKPNIYTCPVCLGLPGALPVPNKKAIDWTIMVGLALNCSINKQSKFDRKHYFYPDLPKGYQISQYDEPFCVKGSLDINSNKVGITRVHLEEDTGKLLHKKIKGKNVTLVDFNRSGVPLVEIVTEPDIHSAQQTKEFSQKLQQIIRYLEVSDCDMEKGSMRLEANISWGLELDYKVEVKNLNSFKFLEKAINYELKRQKKILNSGETPKQETRGWNEKENRTISQRYKETAADYRYFPEPDIPPLKFTSKFIKKIKDQLPELPQKKQERFIKIFKISPQYANILITSKQTAQYAQKVFKLAQEQKLDPNNLAGLIVNKKISIKTHTPAELVAKIKDQLSTKVADTDSLNQWSQEAIKALPQAVKDYKSGKVAAISVLIGKVMQISKGKADASLLKKILQEKLNKSS